MDSAVLSAFSLALGLGLLVGLQPERAGSTVAGSRTFPWIALVRAMCGLLAGVWGDLIVVAGFIGVISMAVLANLSTYKEGTDDVRAWPTRSCSRAELPKCRQSDEASAIVLGSEADFVVALEPLYAGIHLCAHAIF